MQQYLKLFLRNLKKLNKSEKYRYECELRFISNMELEERRRYLSLVEQARGKKATEHIKQGLVDLWNQKKSKIQ